MKAYRKFITTTVAFIFVVVGATGVTFKLFFRDHALEEIHGWLGLALVTIAIFHIAQNWTHLRGYLRDRRVFAILIPIALVIALVTFGGNEAGGGVEPRQFIHKLSQGSATDVAKAFGKDVNVVFASMRNDGLQVDNQQETVQQLARENQKSPDRILAYFAR
jgi:hypothetical protein